MTWLEQLVALHSTRGDISEAGVGEPVGGRKLIGKVAAAADFLADTVDRTAAPVPALLSSNADAIALIIGGVVTDRPSAPLGPGLAVAELTAMVSAMESSVLIAEPRFSEVANSIAQSTGCQVLILPTFQASDQPLTTTGADTAFYLHTAGTTGRPKRVRFTQSVLAARTELLTALFGFRPESRYATGSPLHHVGGLGNMLAALTAGASVMPTVRFTVEWWRGLADAGVTHCLLVPAMVEMLLARQLLDVVHPGTLIYGGSPMAPDTLRRVITDLPNTKLFNLYGQTEGSPIAVLDDDDHRRAAAGHSQLLGSAGRTVLGLRARIAGPDQHGVGEIVVAGDHLAQPDADGWLHTGDLGAFDADGYLFLSGRLNDMIVRGGENIYPVEIEQALRHHRDVRDVGVVGVPDRRLGETVAAFVVPLDPGAPPRIDDLADALRGELAAFKIPTEWQFVDSLPYNAAGKLLRPKLTSRHSGMSTRAR